MTVKDWIKVAIFLVVFYATARYALGAVAWLFTKPEKVILFDTSVSGQVTGIEENRQAFRHFLDGSQKTYYNFNHFVPAEPLPTGLAQEEINRRSLGPFLRKGDYIEKVANDTTLVVRRGRGITRWVCSPTRN